MDLQNKIYVRRKENIVNESFLLVIVIIHLAVNHLCSRKNHLIAIRRIE